MLRKTLLAGAFTLLAMGSALADTTTRTPKIDFADPAVQSQLDAYMDQWVNKHADKVFTAVQNYVAAEQAKSQPQMADFMGRLDELLASDAPHDGADIASAKVVVIEFFDFNCPYCHELHEALATVKQKNKDAAFIYRDFPVLSGSLPTSMTAAYAGRAAEKQGKYSEMANGLYSQPPHGITEEGIVANAKAAGLDMVRFEKDRNSDEVKAEVQKNFDQGKSFKISGTPFIFLYVPGVKKGAIVGGYAPAEQLQSMIEALEQGKDVVTN